MCMCGCRLGKYGRQSFKKLTMNVLPKKKKNSAGDEYRTPPSIVEYASKRWGRFDFDLACNKQNCVLNIQSFTHIPVQVIWSDTLWREFDGLSAKYLFDHGWCNPPYSETGRWVEALSESKNKVTMLIPFKGDKWWMEHVKGRASEVLLLRRINFLMPDGSPTNQAAGCVALVHYNPAHRPAQPYTSFLDRVDVGIK